MYCSCCGEVIESDDLIEDLCEDCNEMINGDSNISSEDDFIEDIE
jgi:hypothetical protein